MSTSPVANSLINKCSELQGEVSTLLSQSQINRASKRSHREQPKYYCKDKNLLKLFLLVQSNNDLIMQKFSSKTRGDEKGWELLDKEQDNIQEKISKIKEKFGFQVERAVSQGCYIFTLPSDLLDQVILERGRYCGSF